MPGLLTLARFGSGDEPGQQSLAKEAQRLADMFLPVVPALLKQDQLVDKYITTLNIRPANPEHLIKNLSGGNQQKVLLARWLILEPRLLILDEPTRGIDVGAKAEIQRLVTELSDDGMSVLFISAELEEVLRLSHKIGVLRDRRLIAELANDEHLTSDVLMETIASGSGS